MNIRYAKCRLKTNKHSKVTGKYYQCRVGGMAATDRKKKSDS